MTFVPIWSPRVNFRSSSKEFQLIWRPNDESNTQTILEHEIFSWYHDRIPSERVITSRRPIGRLVEPRMKGSIHKSFIMIHDGQVGRTSYEREYS
jgi:hypothetical protein